MKIFIPLLIIMLTVQVGPAACRSVTFYSDGAVIELDAVATKGTLEIPLSAAMIEGSLRVKPGSGTSIQRVDIVPAAADTGKGEKELDALLEQKNRLADRLQALSTREEIFKSAAKSQGGKAPRKTKTNPDPMQTIRQGTEFAIAQLEAVYTARRKTEQEIRRIDTRIAAAKKGGLAAEALARIHLSTPRGRVSVRYAVAGQSWTPRYDIHLDDSHTAELHLSALFSGSFNGYLLQASPARLADQGTARVLPVQAGPTARLASYRLPVSEERFGTGIQSSFSFNVRNSQQVYLPGGDANLYRSGEYVGRFRFEGISSGRSKTVSIGM
ncbi:MAG: hypothetical protein JJE30_02015 [Desulfuromonadales bacterium]|nr:hypothetical protein [Desulfuromonadales bacterium]